jgi:hypothetical protein
MNRLLVSTVIRHAPPGQSSGMIYTIDLSTQDVLRCSPMIEPLHREYDPNPNGGLRGARGIAIHPDRAAIANNSTIYLFDPRWKALGSISHPAMGAIHDIIFQGDNLWASSARNDLLLQFDLSGSLLQKVDLRQASPAKAALGWKAWPVIEDDLVGGGVDFRDPRTYDDETYNRAHVNSLCALANGVLLVSLGLVVDETYSAFLRLKRWLRRRGWWAGWLALNRGLRHALRLPANPHSELLLRPGRARSAVLRLEANGKTALLFTLENMLAPSHSLLSLADGSATYLDTTHGSLLRFDPLDGRLLAETGLGAEFLRGTEKIDPQTLLLGDQATLLRFDLASRRCEPLLQLSRRPHEAIFAIRMLPEHYAPLPEALSSL